MTQCLLNDGLKHLIMIISLMDTSLVRIFEARDQEKSNIAVGLKSFNFRVFNTNVSDLKH